MPEVSQSTPDFKEEMKSMNRSILVTLYLPEWLRHGMYAKELVR
jgi:hypothetical protein